MMKNLSFLTAKNIIRFVVILILLATLFPPVATQGVLDIDPEFFLLLMPYPANYIAFTPLLFRYLFIILIGIFLYTFKQE